MSHSLGTTFCLLLAGVLAASSPQAAPVSFLTGAVSQVDATPHGDNNFDVDRDIGQRMQASAGGTFSTQLGGSVSSSANAQADLQTGKVRVGTALTMTNQDDGFVAMATGFIGDGYQHFVGDNPFTWTASSTARFDMRVTGNASLTGNLRELFNTGLLFLMIYPKDTLEDQIIPFCGAFQSYFWSIGPSANRQAPCNGGFQGNLDGTGDQMVSLSFSHPGDFDWVFGMRVGGAAFANPNTTLTWLNDFFSTAELFYTPPAGVTSIRSGSGFTLAQGPAAAVPLPSSLALLGLGLTVLGLTSRRAMKA